MDMWNWLSNCYEEGSLRVEDLEKVLEDKVSARILFEDWTCDSNDYIEYVQRQVWPFLQYVKDRQKREKEKHENES